MFFVSILFNVFFYLCPSISSKASNIAQYFYRTSICSSDLLISLFCIKPSIYKLYLFVFCFYTFKCFFSICVLLFLLQICPRHLRGHRSCQSKPSHQGWDSQTYYELLIQFIYLCYSIMTVERISKLQTYKYKAW